MARQSTNPAAVRAAPDVSGGGGGVRTVSFVSLGCPKNLVDSEKMLGLLAEDGLAPVSAETGEAADAIVVNTCGFLEASKEESLDVIRDAVRKKQRGDVKRVIVAGCLVQRHRAKLLEWAPGIDAMIGVFDRDHIVDAVRGQTGVVARRSLAESTDGPKYWIAGNALAAAKERGLKTTGLTVNGKDGAGIGYFESDAARLRLTPRHYAYLRVGEGCNQNCAFCTIPSIRGKMRSKPIARIVEEARELLRDGAFELNLIGQDTTSYGDDIGVGFDPRAALRDPSDFASMGGLPSLLHALDAVVREEGSPRGAEGARGWLRLMYAYPSNFDIAMMRAIASLEHVVKYIDIPLQHASDAVLTRMRRNVTAARQRETIERLRDAAPGMAVRTTFITGFPGETEADHEALLAFIEDMRFDMLGVFEYSREEGTPAGTMEEDAALAVPADTKRRRKDEIMRLQQAIAFDQASFVAEQFDATRPSETGARFDVLIDSVGTSAGASSSRDSEAGESRMTAGRAGARTQIPSRNGAHTATGRAYFQAPQIDSVIKVRSEALVSPGDLIRCVVVGSEGYDLIAKPEAEVLDEARPTRA